MKASEFKFKVTNKDGVSAIISLSDLTGYQGCWIVANNIPYELVYQKIDDELDFEYIKGENNNEI